MAGRALDLLNDSTSKFGHFPDDFSTVATHTNGTTMRNKTPTIMIYDQSMTSAKRSHSELQALTLLDGIRQARDAQLKKDQELDKSVAEQIELAMARYSMGTSYGAKLRMNMVKRIRSERRRVNSAIELLELHSNQVESKLHEALSSSLPLEHHDTAD
jgi:hypothetical protein